MPCLLSCPIVLKAFTRYPFQVEVQHILVSHATILKPLGLPIRTEVAATDVSLSSRKESVDHRPDYRCVPAPGAYQSFYLSFQRRRITVQPKAFAGGSR